MQLKECVRLRDLNPQISLAALVVNSIFLKLAPKVNCTITSANDSKHMKGSLHYKGAAIDFRTKDFPEDKKTLLVSEVQGALGPEFDVLLEYPGEDNEHLHVEYDPG